MSSKEESVLCNEIFPHKLCSPPPKPPRRRYSDQPAVFLSGTRVSSKTKQFNGNISPSAKVTSIISTSGSESLPSNWNPESPKSKLKKEKPLLKKSGHNSLKTMKLFSQISPPEKNRNLEKQLFRTENNNLVQDFSAFKCGPNFKSSNLFVNKELSGCRNPELSLDSTLSSLKHASDSKIIHRRHHSDPVMLKFNKPFKTVPDLQMKQSVFETPSFRYIAKGSKSSAFMMNDNFKSSEIQFQKEINDKLWQHLCLLRAKLDSFQQSHNCPKNDDSDHPSFAELMFDVYKAQRERDTALQNRLQAAVELKDAAIQELEEVLRMVVRNFECDDFCVHEDESKSEELGNLFQKLDAVEYPADIFKQQRSVLAHLCQAKENKVKQLSHALRVAEEERDQAFLEKKRLEDEICRLKSSSAMLQADGVSGSKWESSLLDTVLEIVNQQGSAFAKVKSLQAKILSHAHQSDTDYEGSQKLNSIPPYCAAYDHIHELTNDMNGVSHFETTTDNVEILKSELSNLAQLFTNEIKKRQSAEESCVKLQRMLNFVLERVNGGLNIGVPV